MKPKILKNFILLLSIYIALLFAIISVAQIQEKRFVYDSHGKRDPFVPLVSLEGEYLTSTRSTGSLGDVVLEGIIFDPKGRSLAIISGNIVTEGDYIGDFQVRKIENESVILFKDMKEYKLEVIQGE